MEGYEASTYGDRFADVYDEWYAEVTDVDACLSRIERLVDEAGGGPVLELGVGSGRLAIPLAQRGVEVYGLDASQAMLERLAAKPGGSLVRAQQGDMAAVELLDAPLFAVVLLAFNTLFNLPTEAEQRRCLGRCASLIAPSGTVVVEAFVPDDSSGAAAQAAVEPRHIGLDEVVLRVSRSDPASQTVTGQHVHLSEAGIRMRPWFLRWATPAQLDEMAAGAGLELAWRAAGWRDEPFDHHTAHTRLLLAPCGRFDERGSEWRRVTSASWSASSICPRSEPASTEPVDRAVGDRGGGARDAPWRSLGATVAGRVDAAAPLPVLPWQRGGDPGRARELWA